MLSYWTYGLWKECDLLFVEKEHSMYSLLSNHTDHSITLFIGRFCFSYTDFLSNFLVLNTFTNTLSTLVRTKEFDLALVFFFFCIRSRSISLLFSPWPSQHFLFARFVLFASFFVVSEMQENKKPSHDSNKTRWGGEKRWHIIRRNENQCEKENLIPHFPVLIYSSLS